MNMTNSSENLSSETTPKTGYNSIAEQNYIQRHYAADSARNQEKKLDVSEVDSTSKESQIKALSAAAQLDYFIEMGTAQVATHEARLSEDK